MGETNSNRRKIFAVGLCGLLVWTNLWASLPTNAAVAPPLMDLVREPYLVLLEQAEELKFSKKRTGCVPEGPQKGRKSGKEEAGAGRKEVEAAGQGVAKAAG